MNKIIICLIFLLIGNCCFAEALRDDVAEKLIRVQPKPEVHLAYNYESTIKVPVTLKPLMLVKSEDELYEGQKIQFKVARDVLYKNKVVISRGTIATARVSIIITPGMNGIPASIILDKFEIDKIKSSQLTSRYEIFGQDRSLLVFPLKWALTILPPTGSLTNFIMGGHAKIKRKQVFTIYYYPEWK